MRIFRLVAFINSQRVIVLEITPKISQLSLQANSVRKSYYLRNFWRENSNNHCSIHFQFCQMRLFALNFQQCAMAGPAAAGWSLAILALVFDLSEFLVRRCSDDSLT